MLSNFTQTDIVGSVEASLLLTLILFIPGYVIGWLTNVFEFRQRRIITQAMLSTPLAVALLPILVYYVGRYPTALWAFFGASWITFAVLLRRTLMGRPGSGLPRIPRAIWIGGSFAVLWSLVAIATLVDLQFKNRLYFSVPAYDYSLRTALTAAATKAIPPNNPFFANIPTVPLRYHYFWMLICSLAARLGHIGARQAMYGGTVWAGIALMSLIAICLKFFLNVRERLERKVFIGWGLLLVTGLDILPTLYLYVHSHAIAPDMEWWNVQITSWVDALLWTPHHMMGLVACMVGFVLLRQSVKNKHERAVAIILAGLAFASAVGLSVLVTFTFAAFIALWLLVATLRKWWDDAIGLLAAGGLALAAALPYLSQLTGPGLDGSGGGGRFFAVSIREFPLGIYAISSAIGVPYYKLTFLALPLLPLNYFLELGFFFFIGALRIKSIRSGSTPMTRLEETGWTMVATSFFVGSLLRSTTIGSNDLGWRCFVLAQLVLLLWAALLVDDWWAAGSLAALRRNKAAVFAGILLLMGVVGTLYQVTMLRAYPILHDEGSLDPKAYPFLYLDRKLGERTYALRSVYDQLSTMLPEDAIIQYNPNTLAFVQHELYSVHDAAIGLQLCGTVFGGTLDQCMGRIKSVPPLFKRPSLTQSASLDDTCREYRIKVILVDDDDPVWKQGDSWVWTRVPLLANDHVRAFYCGDRDSQAQLARMH
jgi:hypothetical protein